MIYIYEYKFMKRWIDHGYLGYSGAWESGCRHYQTYYIEKRREEQRNEERERERESTWPEKERQYTE